MQVDIRGKQELSLREIQEASLEVLKKIAEICEQEHLRYFLTYGTLIGAIRHKGFIPWDDDIDLWMPRPDYERFLEYFEQHKDELLPLQVLNDRNCKDYPYLITRVSDSRYFLDVINEKHFGLGCFVDIYPLDGLGNNLDEAKKTVKKASRLSSLIFLSTRRYLHKGNTKSLAKLMIKLPAFLFCKLYGKKRFAAHSYRLAERYPYESSDYVCCVLWTADRELYRRKDLENAILADFEGGKYRVPAEYDTVLRQYYDDYMQLPPEEDRVPHHLYKAYKISD